MKLTCEREKLLAAFQTAGSVAPARSPKPILQNVKIEAAGDTATLMATDLEIGIRVQLGGVETPAAGSAILPIGRFTSILRESSDASIQIESDGQSTIVRGDRSEFRLQAENPDEFPVVAGGDAEKAYHELPARLFREIIRRTAFATDTESSRYALGGVLLELTAEKITAVGTDGRRLAKMEAPAQGIGGHKTGDNTVIVPTKAMHLMERALSDNDAEIQLIARPNEVLVKSQRVTIYSRLVEGRFPKWRDVFPQRTTAQRIDCMVGPLHAAVRQAAIVTSDESRGVDFRFGNDQLSLTSSAADVGSSQVETPIPYSGDPIDITFDPHYLLDALKTLSDDTPLVAELIDDRNAAVFRTEDRYSYVVMPLTRER